MKIAEVKKELSYLLETSIKSVKDLRLAATTDSKLAEVMKAWSFLNYTEEYSWNVLLDKLVADTSLINKAKDYLVTNWDVKESDLIVGRTYIEIKYGYQLTAVIHLTSSGDLTCASFTGNVLFEELMMLIEIVQGEGVKEDLGSQCGGGTVAPLNQDKVNYIVTLTDYPQIVIKDDYNPKELTEVTEEQLLGSLYTDKVTAEMMFPGSYYQVLEVNPNNIKQQLMQHYNLEETSDIVATVTSDNKFYALVHSQADEVYIVTPYCLNPKRLVDCKDKELKESLYHCKEVAADEANEWLGDSYQVVEIDYNNIRCDIKAYFRNRVLVSQLNCYLPKDEASTKDYYYKGVSVDHFSNYTEMYNDVLNPVDSGNPTVTLLGSFQHTKWVYCSEIKVSSSIEAVKVAKNYLSTGVKQQKVPSTEVKPFDYSLELAKLKSLSSQEFMALIQEVQHVKHFSSYYLPKWEVVETYFTKEEYELATNTEQIQDDDDCHWLKLVNIQDCFSEAGNYHYSQMQLTPKLELFAKFIEYTFLMQCYLELIGYFYNLSSSLSEISNQLYLTWCSLTAICFKRYVLMPTIGSDNHTKLLMIWHTYNSLECKSSYA